MIFIINAQGTITAVSPSPVHQGSIGVNDIILVSPALANEVTLNATLPNGIKIDPIDMGLVYPSVIEGYTEGYYIYRVTLDESVTQYSGLLSLRFSLKLKEGGTLTTSTAVIPIAEDMSIIELPAILSLDNNADTGTIVETVNKIINRLNSTNSNASSAENAAYAAEGYQKQAQAWATGEKGDNPVEDWEQQYNNNAKYYADKSAESAERSENSAIESELWATGSHNNVVYTKVEQTKNNAKYYAQATKSLLESISISYDYETYKLTIEYTLPNSSVVTKEYDFALDPSIVSIDEVEKDGKYYLSLTLANGNKTEIELDDIFEGFVKAQAEANKIYGTDADKKDTVYPIDNEGAISKGSIVRRTYNNGGICVPSTPEAPDEAASKSYVDKFVPIEPYNDFVSGVPVIYSRDHNGDVVPLTYDDIVFWDGEELPFDPDDIDSKYGGCIVQRGIDGEIYVPLVPDADAQAVSKKYVDDAVQNALSGGSAKLYKHRVSISSIYNEETWAEDPSFEFHVNFYRSTATPVTSLDEIQNHELMLEKMTWFTEWDGPDAQRTAIALRKAQGRLYVEYIYTIYEYGYEAVVFETSETSYSPDKFKIIDTVYEV